MFIQNQKENHLRKWDKVGIVVEVLKYDQYVIKISWSGRLTTSNRRFLRLIPAPDKPTAQVPSGPRPTTQTTRFMCHQRQTKISAPTSVDTETPIGAQR